MKLTNIKKVYKKEFDIYEFQEAWLNSFGQPEKNFSSIIFGESGNGKTDFCVKLSKYLSAFGRVLYVSNEEGLSSTIQTVFMRNNMIEVHGKVILAEKARFESIMEYLKGRNRPKILLIDSLDYTRLTAEQYRTLRAAFPRIAIIIVAWSKGKQPKSQAARDIEYMVDVKIFVKDFIAFPRSRYGGNIPFIIWREGALKRNPAVVADVDKGRNEYNESSVAAALNILAETLGIEQEEKQK